MKGTTFYVWDHIFAPHFRKFGGKKGISTLPFIIPLHEFVSLFFGVRKNDERNESEGNL